MQPNNPDGQPQTPSRSVTSAISFWVHDAADFFSNFLPKFEGNQNSNNTSGHMSKDEAKARAWAGLKM